MHFFNSFFFLFANLVKMHKKQGKGGLEGAFWTAQYPNAGQNIQQGIESESVCVCVCVCVKVKERERERDLNY